MCVAIELFFMRVVLARRCSLTYVVPRRKTVLKRKVLSDVCFAGSFLQMWCDAPASARGGLGCVKHTDRSGPGENADIGEAQAEPGSLDVLRLAVPGLGGGRPGSCIPNPLRFGYV